MRRVEVFEDKAGEWRFRRLAENGEIVLTSEGYTRKADAIEAAQRELPDDYITAPGLFDEAEELASPE